MRNTPKIRLNGFSGEWEQRKLGDVLKVNSGKDYKHLNPGDIPVYGTGGYMLSVDESLSEEDAIGIGRKGTIDKPQLLKAPFWTVDTLFYITPLPENDLRFLYALSQNIKWAKLDESTGVPSLSKTNIENIQINLPPTLAEQTAIGKFFATLDETIRLHTQKLAGLRQLKKGYLQQLFPRAGEPTPRVRFDGFSGDWECRKLGEVSSIKTGASDVQDAVADGAYPFFVRSEKIERSSKYLFDGEAILIPGEGRLGDIYHYINGKFDYHQRVYKISDFANNVSGLFILYAMQKTFKQHAMTYTVKATVDSLRLPMLTGFDVLLPSKSEQTAIGNFFRNLDDQITAQQTKTEHLQQLKKAYLQQMFV